MAERPGDAAWHPPAPREHQHTFVFLRTEEVVDPPRATVRNDVFFCSGCLEYARVETWRGRESW